MRLSAANLGPKGSVGFPPVCIHQSLSYSYQGSSYLTLQLSGNKTSSIEVKNIGKLLDHYGLPNSSYFLFFGHVKRPFESAHTCGVSSPFYFGNEVHPHKHLLEES